MLRTRRNIYYFNTSCSLEWHLLSIKILNNHPSNEFQQMTNTQMYAHISHPFKFWNLFVNSKMWSFLHVLCHPWLSCHSMLNVHEHKSAKHYQSENLLNVVWEFRHIMDYTFPCLLTSSFIGYYGQDSVQYIECKINHFSFDIYIWEHNGSGSIR
jgi:hypothetical protein